jgi:hypothetical protein
MGAIVRQPATPSTLGHDDGWDAASVNRSTSDTIEGTATTTPRAVILVEGVSDRRALETLAARRGRVLTDDGVTVVAMDGVGNIGFLDRYGPRGSDVALAG